MNKQDKLWKFALCECKHDEQDHNEIQETIYSFVNPCMLCECEDFTLDRSQIDLNEIT